MAIKIKTTIGTLTVLEFNTLDEALRNITGINERGDKFGKPLLETQSRRTFKEATAIMERNGYEIVGAQEDVKEVLKESIKKESSKKTEENGADVWAMMAKHIQEYVDAPKTEINMDQVKAEIDAAVAEAVSKNVKEIVVVKKETGERKEVGTQHFQFETLLMTIAARVNALMVGPAGSGKTSAAHAAAVALNIPFYSISVGMQTTKTEFFGYTDATGKYVRTLFREAFEKGGVFLIDEMDAGNANVITSINQALANGYCAFPDGMISKHNDFVIISSANTYGNGTNREYVGRNQLDAATLDRFAVIEWNYDTDLEGSLCGNKEWLMFVRKCRANADKHKVRTVISPRASILGAQLIAQGIKLDAVKDMLIFKGMNETEKAKLVE